jgi:hypothetical protein
MYKDPLDALIEEEEKTCKGCIHRDRIGKTEVCNNPEVKSVLAKGRCDKYETIE